MKLAVLGVGAIGGVTGGYLARAGEDVTLIDPWPANIERIKSHGLTVKSVAEEFTVRAKALHLGEVSAARPSFDAVILSVKSYDTSWTARFIAPYLAAGGIVVSAQNSINEEAIAAEVGWTRVMGCVVTLGSAIYEPGRVERTSDVSRPAYVVGEPSGMITPRLEKVAEVLKAVGPVRTTSNLWGERWAKLAVNCMANAVAGITGLTSLEVRQKPESREVAVRIAEEVVKVAVAWGVSVEPISGIPAPAYSEALRDTAKMDELIAALIEKARGLGEGRPSLAQDILKGRKTEVDHLNGYVVRKGEEVGVQAPLNKAICEVTRQVESGELSPSISNLQLLGDR